MFDAGVLIAVCMVALGLGTSETICAFVLCIGQDVMAMHARDCPRFARHGLIAGLLRGS